jgi:phosphonate transport system permease protein
LIKNKALYFGTRRFLEFLRGVPELVWALIFVFAFKIGPLPGILAIFVHSTGSLGKMFAEVNENISMEDVEGIRSTGGNWFQIMRFGVVPQVLPNYISYAILRFEINIRASTILGFVGAGGIGHELNLAIRQFHYTDVSAICLMIIGMVILLDFFSEKLRGRIMKGAKLK